jgi:predicted secreted protein
MTISVGTGATTPTLIGFERSATLTLSLNNADVSNKSSNDWTERLPTFRDWTIEGEAIFDPSDSAQDDLWTAYNTRNKVNVLVTIAGDTYEGDAYLSELSFEGGHDAEIAGSFSLEGTGQLTKVE